MTLVRMQPLYRYTPAPTLAPFFVSSPSHPVHVKDFTFCALSIYVMLNVKLVQVDSVNKHGILLQVVQVLTDLNLVITKAYISSDGGWFMDGKLFLFTQDQEIPYLPLIILFIISSVFNVIDQVGNKVRDEEIISYIQKVFHIKGLFFLGQFSSPYSTMVYQQHNL